MSEVKTELNYIVWQYLEKEAPSIAKRFQKLRKIKAKEGFQVTLAGIYDIYTKNNSDVNKRQIEQETSLSSANKKQCLDLEEENSEELNILGSYETKAEKADILSTEDENKEEKDTSTGIEEHSSQKMHANDDKSSDNKKPLLNEKKSASTGIEEHSTQKKMHADDDKSSDNKKPLLNEKKSASTGIEEHSTQKKMHADGDKSSDNKKPLLNEKKSAKEKSESNKIRRKRPLLPKPPSNKKNKSKRPLLAAPFSSFHQNDPKLNRRGNTRKPLLPGLVPTIEPSGRKTLLVEPLHGSVRNERKPLLFDIPMHAYLEDEKIRRTLLTEPSQLFEWEERSRKPLLMEPIPPPLMRESTSKIDRMALLDGSVPLKRLHPDSNERISLLSHPSLSNQLDALYRREKKSLLDEPPPASMMIDYLKRKEKQSLLMDPPSSEHYYDSRDRKVGLLTDSSLSLGLEEDVIRKRRALLSDHSSPLPSREHAMDSLKYSRKETSPLPKSLTHADIPEYEDSSRLFTRRARTAEPTSDTSNWKEKGILLAQLENYLKRLSQTSNITERNSLLAKPDDSKKYEAPDRVFDPSRMSPESYQYYMREKTALLARKEYHQALSESSGFAENTRIDKPRSDLYIINEKTSHNKEALMPVNPNRGYYEESLKSVHYNLNSELSHAYRRASGNPRDRDIEHMSYERYDGKMGYL